MEPLAVDEAAGDGNSWTHPRRGKNPKSLWAVFELKCPHCDERIKVATPMRGNTTPPPSLLDRLRVNLTGGKNICPSCGISYRDDFIKNTLEERLEWDSTDSSSHSYTYTCSQSSTNSYANPNTNATPQRACLSED